MKYILEVLYRWYVVILVVLDMSATFYTVDHEILLHACILLHGTTLRNVWYHADVDALPAKAASLHSTQVLLVILSDDTFRASISIPFEMTDETNRLLSLRRIEHCMNDICMWMVSNLLKVNDDKTVALVLAS